MTILLKAKEWTNCRMSFLKKLTMSAIMLSLVAVGAETMTIPQLENRFNESKEAVKSSSKEFDKAIDAVKSAEKARKKAEDNLQDYRGDIAKLKAKYAKASEKDQPAIHKQIEEKQAEAAIAEAMVSKTEKNLQAAKANADTAKKAMDSAVENRKATEAQLATARANAKTVALAKTQAEKDAEAKAAAAELAKKQAEKDAAAKPAAPVAVAAAPAPAAQPAPAAPAAKPAEQAKASVADGAYHTSWTPAEERELPPLRGGQRLTVPEAKNADIADEAAVIPEFDMTMVSGDKDVVENLQIWKDWSSFVVFNKVTPKQINEFHGQLLKALHEEGYVFAQVSFPTRIWSTGIFLAKVDLGKLGEITVRNQKHYSPEQIANALRGKDGNFNYNKVNKDLFDLNVKPDLKLNTQLTTSTINGRRVINADIDVKDSLPIHGAIELSNTGSKASDSDWRLRATLQHVNLTKHGDVLTLDWMTGANVADDVNAYSASYFLPLGDANHLNIFGGYSSKDVDDVMPDLSVRGKGFFAGFAWTHTLYETVKERVEISLGWFYQKHENYETIEKVKYEDGDLTVSMPTLTLGYSSKVFDGMNGRNFASLTLKQNRAGTFFSSSEHEFQKTLGIDGDFFIANLQLARFQRLFSGENHPGKWTLYAKANAQAASDNLPAILREYVGGMTSVRGYIESELGGDHAVAATLELRTPLLEDFIPGLKSDDPAFRDKNPDHWSQHRLQFVAFTDFGYVCENDKETSSDDQTFLSVGAGIRLGLTKYAQMAVDYGYPIIEASDDTPDAGRFHVSLQLQF
ncbi:MAG: BamA/TamA family outer membrane protein [Victivallales bacterium]|nr:BamA/TamA family outer membrane protein [Victivallales bacterium]